MQDGVEDAARILKARWHAVLRLASRGTLAGDSLRPCLTSPPGQFSTNVPSTPTKPGRTASPPCEWPTTRPLSARAASADWTAEWARMPEYADRRPTAWPGGLSAPGTLSLRAGWCRGLFRSYSGSTSDTEGGGDGHRHGEQGLLLADPVPADLPRVHVGGLRQVGLGHPKLRPAQADSFTQVHDPFNASGEHCPNAIGQTGRPALRHAQMALGDRILTNGPISPCDISP